VRPVIRMNPVKAKTSNGLHVWGTQSSPSTQGRRDWKKTKWDIFATSHSVRIRATGKRKKNADTVLRIDTLTGVTLRDESGKYLLRIRENVNFHQRASRRRRRSAMAAEERRTIKKWRGKGLLREEMKSKKNSNGTWPTYSIRQRSERPGSQMGRQGVCLAGGFYIEETRGKKQSGNE